MTGNQIAEDQATAIPATSQAKPISLSDKSLTDEPQPSNPKMAAKAISVATPTSTVASTTSTSHHIDPQSITADRTTSSCRAVVTSQSAECVTSPSAKVSQFLSDTIRTYAVEG